MSARRKDAAASNKAKSSRQVPTIKNGDLSMQLPLELDQLMLDQFVHAFPFSDASSLHPVIQQVKGHLFNRDFLTAFSSPTYLQAYALRWSASRALAYARIFGELQCLREWHMSATTEVSELHDRAYRVLCIGGGAGAELVGLMSTLHDTSSTGKIQVTAIDIADWAAVLNGLEQTMIAPLPLSKFASQAAKGANRAFIEGNQLDVQFVRQDILDDRGLLEDTFRNADLCTIMFTLNELFSSSIAKTTALLLNLAEMNVGSHLLVVDSPGSYSEVKLGKQDKSKQYPMQWLMDHTMLDTAKGTWEKIMSNDSQWFRLSSELKYPIELENMRYQIHLYRRLGL